jgi:uncharacterized linocin/CFP29 family protein
MPMFELRVPFEMRRCELDAIDRGAKDPDTDPVIETVRAIAIAEDRASHSGGNRCRQRCRWCFRR